MGTVSGDAAASRATMPDKPGVEITGAGGRSTAPQPNASTASGLILGGDNRGSDPQDVKGGNSLGADHQVVTGGDNRGADHLHVTARDDPGSPIASDSSYLLHYGYGDPQ